MARYVTRSPAKSLYCDSWQGAVPASPIVDEGQYRDTGLLDEHGNRIFRAPNPIGFGRDDEW